MFKDRYEAAMQLAKKLEKFKNKDGIVLAVPRGGVPIGYVVAKELGLPLEVILSKKIGHPYNPEFAVGSVSLYGTVINDSIIDFSMEYIHKEVERLLKVLNEKNKLYMGNRKPTDLKDKTVIIVDDGIATGNTILATLEGLRKCKPKEIIIAVPVAPPSTVSKLSKYVDEFICLLTPDNFSAVGQFYDTFLQVSDDEVIKLLHDSEKLEAVT